MLDTIGTLTRADLQDLVDGDYTAEAAWLLTTLMHVDLRGPEIPGEWATCFAPVDWPALVAAHPDDLRPAGELMAVNSSPSWAATCKAMDLLAQRVCSPRLWVALLVEPTGELSLYALGLLGDGLDADGDADIIAAVDALLSSERHGSAQLHVRSPTDWQLF